MRDLPTMRIRASSFAGLFDCAKRWAAVHLDGLASPSSPRALIGSGVHAGTAAFDQARIEGGRGNLDEAAGMAIDEIAHRIAEEPVIWHADEPNRREVERIATRLTLNYCEHISPRYEFESVELACTPLKVETNGVVIELTGHLDRSRIIARETANGVRRRLGDLKTGKAAVNKAGRAATKKHRAQIGTYEVLYEHTTGQQLDRTSEILGLNTSDDFRFGTGEITGARELLLGTAADPGLIEMAGTMLKSGLFPPNPQSALCGKKYCPLHQARACMYADYSED